jgi:LysM repeat protein
VRPGETLWIIAARYGVAWEDVAAVNGLGERSLLQIGQELKLPASATAAAEAAPVVETVLAAEGAAVESAPVAENAPADESAVGELTGRVGSAPATKQAEADAAPAPTIVLTVPAVESAYTVRAGDTLSAIAARHDITWQALAAANGLGEGSYLQIGQSLTIPGAGEPVRLRQTTDATGGPVTVLAAARAYTVRSGDTVMAIALRHEVDWQELLRVNGLDEESILQPGQILQLP